MLAHVLTTKGASIVDSKGQQVLLRGVGLGGWMNMENYITGYAANEEAQRQVIRRVLGHDNYEFFFDRFLDAFFGRLCRVGGSHQVWRKPSELVERFVRTSLTPKPERAGRPSHERKAT